MVEENGRAKLSRQCVYSLTHKLVQYNAISTTDEFGSEMDLYMQAGRRWLKLGRMSFIPFSFALALGRATVSGGLAILVVQYLVALFR